MTGPGLEVVVRPNGKPYRPRKLTACAVNDEDENLSGVVVFGTHDPGRALPLAREYAEWQLGKGFTAVSPQVVWWRDGFVCGRRCWVDDEELGRAGVYFSEVVEVSR